MRATLMILAVLAVAGIAAASNSTAAAGKEPTCSDLTMERGALVQEAARVTSEVESKNLQLGETSDALAAAKSAPRKTELDRRAEGLRRELVVLLDRELEATNRLGFLDSQLAKRCGKKGGGK